MMIFEKPEFLYALFILPPIALFIFIRHKQTFFITEKLTLEKPFLIKLRAFYSGLFYLLTLCSLIIASAAPAVLTFALGEAETSRELVFAFDVSRSMNVRDCIFENENISRLEASKTLAVNLLGETQKTASAGDAMIYRYALALGKGDGVLAVPLTYSTEAINAFFNSLSSSLISSKSTDTEKLLLAAKTAFNPGVSAIFPAKKEIALFTDGEPHSGSLEDALKLCRDSNITVYIICAGSEKGGAVPLENEETGTVSFLTDNNGKEIISKAMPEKLREAVESSGGVLFSVEDYSKTGGSIIKEIITNENAGIALEKNTAVKNEIAKKTDLSYVFLAASLLFFVLRLFAAHRFTLLKKIKSAAKPAPILICLLSVFIISCENTEAKFRIVEGNFYFSQGNFQKAEDRYKKALLLSEKHETSMRIQSAALYDLANIEMANDVESALSLLEKAHALIGDEHTDFSSRHQHEKRDRDIAFRIHYNAGIIYYSTGDAASSARQFALALLCNPASIEAKRNLEISLMLPPESGAKNAESAAETRPVSEGEGRGSEVLFDFIQKKEEDRWKSWMWQGGEDNSLPDY